VCARRRVRRHRGEGGGGRAQPPRRARSLLLDDADGRGDDQVADRRRGHPDHDDQVQWQDPVRPQPVPRPRHAIVRAGRHRHPGRPRQRGGGLGPSRKGPDGERPLFPRRPVRHEHRHRDGAGHDGARVPGHGPRQLRAPPHRRQAVERLQRGRRRQRDDDGHQGHARQPRRPDVRARLRRRAASRPAGRPNITTPPTRRRSTPRSTSSPARRWAAPSSSTARRPTPARSTSSSTTWRR
jgi:hypothetical protein